MRTVFLGAGGKLGRLLQPRWPARAEWIARDGVDIEDTGTLTRILNGADTVFCLAGVTPGSPRSMNLNVTLAQKVLDAARGAHVFLFSSAAVYGALPGPLRENGPTAPQSDYAAAKLAMERMALAHRTSNTVLRLGNVAGADAILGGWKPGFQLDQYPDGRTPSRSYIGPGKLAQTLHKLAQTPDLPSLLNIAAPEAVEMGALLDAAGFEWHSRPATERTIAEVQLKTAALEEYAPFAPADSTAAGIVQDWKNKEPT
ncbi:NAD-dependent epimerase/dehydratase family protein [Tateyamaria omphalii]|uniref:NAD-dependent epimerase/dehydratase family protein n=1 Tax=Tateyamaria omphalii TaxID=299262 RepID=UPI001C99B95D|nr:NAD-dependent epimerase/dehydratase family protein [Tateyamaria omphalii]MBY5933581.1 NAD-dependent epimerase/dehydratase family protein [Tateyamaria omphalii]